MFLFFLFYQLLMPDTPLEGSEAAEATSLSIKQRAESVNRYFVQILVTQDPEEMPS